MEALLNSPWILLALGYWKSIDWKMVGYSTLAVILIWNLLPIFYVLFGTKAPTKHKLKACVSMVSSALRGLLVLIPDLTAPIVVPIALLFTKWEDEKLPSLFRWWDNDVSINGDKFKWVWDEVLGRGVPLKHSLDPKNEEDIALCYYAPGHHPRSFWARYVWLGLRNRASKLALDLGFKLDDSNKEDREYWGDPAVGRNHEGVVLDRCGSAYQFYAVKKIGSKICIRINYGFKVWEKHPVETKPAMVVNITFSLISWKG